MTTKWLNIILDGNSALAPFWPNIFSGYLQHIIRSYFDNSREEGGHPTCELGLIMYNADPNLDNDLKYINWTKDLDCFIDTLSGLSFNGPNLHQHKIAQGLAEALLMFPRPPNNKLATTEEYFMGERYCILVATGDPIPLKMNVYVPLMKNGNFLPSQLKPLCANFLEVASIFGQLATGLSIITPTQYLMYREIFNSVSKVSHMENHPFEYRMDEITFLLSSNFKEAHSVLHEKGKTVCVTSPIISSAYLEENLTEQIIDGVKNVMLVPENAVTPIHSVIPQATINQTFEPFVSSSKLPRMNVFDDYMENLDNDDCYDSLLPWKKPKFIPTFEKEDNFEDFFLQEKPFMPFNDTLGQEKTSSSNQSISLRSLKEIEGEPTQVTIDIAGQSVSKDIAGEWSSKGQPQELGGGVGIVSPFHISEKFSSSDLSLPQPLVVSTFTTKEGSSIGQGQDLAASNMGIMNHFPTSKTFSSSNFSFSQPMVQSISTIGEGPSKGLAHELGDNTGVGNIIPTLENFSSSNFSLLQSLVPPISTTGEMSLSKIQELRSNMGILNPISTSNSSVSFPQLGVTSNCTLGKGSSGGQAQELGGNTGIMNPSTISQSLSSSSLSSPSPMIESTSTTGKGPSRGLAHELGGNVGVVDIIPTIENLSSSCFSFLPTLVPSTSAIRERSLSGQVQELRGNIGVGNPISTSVNYSNSKASFPQLVGASDCTVKEGSSRGQTQELGDSNVGLAKRTLTLENCSKNSFSFPQLMSPNLLPMGGKDWQCQSGGNNTTIRSGTTDQLLHEPPQISASLGNFMYPNSTKNLLNQFQSASSPSFSLLSYNGDSSNGSGNSSCHQFERHLPFKFTELSYLGTPRMREFALQRNIINVLPPPPFADIKDYVTAWEGCLVGRVHSYRACLNQARVMIKPTLPSSLISAWSSRLEIVIFIPTKAVTHTLKIIGGPINYVFFHITRFNNLDVYQHMIGKNLCAKIELPSETIILRTITESKHHFLGIIVPRETIFVEPI